MASSQSDTPIQGVSLGLLAKWLLPLVFTAGGLYWLLSDVERRVTLNVEALASQAETQHEQARASELLRSEVETLQRNVHAQGEHLGRVDQLLQRQSVDLAVIRDRLGVPRAE